MTAASPHPCLDNCKSRWEQPRLFANMQTVGFLYLSSLLLSDACECGVLFALLRFYWVAFLFVCLYLWITGFLQLLNSWSWVLHLISCFSLLSFWGIRHVCMLGNLVSYNVWILKSFPHPFFCCTKSAAQPTHTFLTLDVWPQLFRLQLL